MALSSFLAISRALGDRTRVRALLALRDRELCLCQLVGLLALAPSTLSKHMNVLADAGLVERRKQGRWQYFRLPGDDAPQLVQRALHAALEALAEDGEIVADRRRVRQLLNQDLETLAECYRT